MFPNDDFSYSALWSEHQRHRVETNGSGKHDRLYVFETYNRCLAAWCCLAGAKNHKKVLSCNISDHSMLSATKWKIARISARFEHSVQKGMNWIGTSHSAFWGFLAFPLDCLDWDTEGSSSDGFPQINLFMISPAKRDFSLCLWKNTYYGTFLPMT